MCRSAPERAKNDLKKQMAARDVRRTIMSFIVQHLGMENSIELDLGASTVASTTTNYGQSQHTPLSESVMSENPVQEGAFHDPLFVHSARELEDTFRDMLPPFEGRETEHNWLARDKNITKIRRLLQGNAPSDFHAAFLAGIKLMLDSIIKFTNTLRTTPSTNACQLCQELYRTLGTAMDPMTELMIQNFVKMSAATKNITAKQADVSMETILSHCSYSSRVMQHIWMSFQEKNMQTRSFAPGWLKIIMKKGASHKSHIEHAGGLELIDKCLKKGLEDASPKVRESTRNAYWTYAQIWHNQAERFVMQDLESCCLTNVF
jgi:CLIP-associating protein 1/2